MPVITFWSDNEKVIGQTVSASIVATVMAMTRNYKILLVSADFNNNSMENCFGAQESNKEILKGLVKSQQINLDSGVNGLMKLADSNRVTPDIIHNYTKIIFNNRLEVLYSPMNIINEEATMEKLKNIVINASKYYDYIIVDLKKGDKYKNQQEILAKSDVIVMNVNQSTKEIEKTLNNNNVKNMSRKLIWNICKYDKNSKYNTKNITRTILKKQDVYEIHYNTLVLEASQEGKIVELLLRFKTLKNEDDNLSFVSRIEEMIEGILLKYQQTRMII